MQNWSGDAVTFPTGPLKGRPEPEVGTLRGTAVAQMSSKHSVITTITDSLSGSVFCHHLFKLANHLLREENILPNFREESGMKSQWGIHTTEPIDYPYCPSLPGSEVQIVPYQSWSSRVFSIGCDSLDLPLEPF